MGRRKEEKAAAVLPPPHGLDKHTAQGRGAPVTFHTFASADEEAEYIALEIQRNVDLARPMLTYADVCILLRFNALSRALEAALQRQRIPYRVIGGPKFFDRAEVKDLLAYLLLVDNPAYTPALLRIINVPRRGIGAKTVQDLEALYGVGRVLVDDTTRWPNWYEGNAFKATRDAQRAEAGGAP